MFRALTCPSSGGKIVFTQHLVSSLVCKRLPSTLVESGLVHYVNWCFFDCIELFHQPTLMHNFLYSLTICLLHYYPRHVSSINMPIFRRKNCIHTASGIFALELGERSYINTYAASYLNNQGLNNSCLKSPASTLVDLTFQSRALRSFSINQLRNLSL